MCVSEINVEIGNRIRDLRISFGLTIDQLAELLEITPAFLGLIERGKRGATNIKLIKLSKIFKVTLDYLLTGSEKQPSLIGEDMLARIIHGFNQHELKTLTNFSKKLSMHGYSKAELTLLSDAINFQIDFLNKIKQ